MRIRNVCIGAAVAVAAVYVGVSVFFIGHFLPHTTVNGTEVSLKNANTSEDIFKDKLTGYELTLIERGDKSEIISADDVGLGFVFNGEFKEMISSQNAFTWPAALFTKHEIQMDKLAEYDSSSFESVVNNLACMDESSWTASADSELGDYKDGSFTLTAAVYGTEIDTTKFNEAVGNALSEAADKIDLEESGCYVDPVITEDNEAGAEVLEAANSYAKGSATLDFGDGGQIVIDGNTVKDWISVGDDYSVTFDDDALHDYICEIAYKYNTIDKSKTLKTTTGQTVTVPAGDYGWKMNVSQTEELVKEALTSGEDYSGDAVWDSKANSHGDNDYGNTYVEINLSAQHLYYYVNGSLVIESDFVSGNPSNGNKTPGGAYAVTYTEKNAVLKGDNYETPVSFWMPFNGNIGMHDATWRSSFGGSIYKTNGSHGCVNLPYSAAKTIFEHISKGDAVLCFYMPGNEPENAVVSETGDDDTNAKADSKKSDKKNSATDKSSSSSSAASDKKNNTSDKSSAADNKDQDKSGSTDADETEDEIIDQETQAE